MKRVAFILCLLLMLATRSFGQATTIWVSQAGAGSNNGLTKLTAAPISALALSSNCFPTGGLEIGADTNLIWTGNFTFAAGANAPIQFACSGTAGHPIHITPDPTTLPVVINSPAFSYGVGSSPAGAISFHNVNYYLLDGGTPCGTIVGAFNSPNPCGFVIENTAMGTAFDAVLVGNMNDQSGLIDGGGGNGIEIENVATLHGYDHLPPVQVSSFSWTGNSIGVVNTSGTTVTYVSGTSFASLLPGELIQINGVDYAIASVTSSSVLVLTASAGTQTGVTYIVTTGTITCSANCPMGNNKNVILINFLFARKVAGSVTSGTFVAGETVKQSTSNVTATLFAPPAATGKMFISQVSNIFTVLNTSGPTWTGQTSGAVYTQTGGPSGITLRSISNNGGGNTIAVSGGPLSGSSSTAAYVIDAWGLASNIPSQGNTYGWCLAAGAPGIKFHDSQCGHGGWLFILNQITTSAPQVYNNQIFDFDHGVTAGVCSAGGCGDGVTFPGPIIYNNHFGDMVNWDDLFDPTNRNLNDAAALGPNNNHHDPIHLLVDLANSGTTARAYIQPIIFNNRFDGDPGVDLNDYFFLRAATQNESVFNNVVLCPTPRPIANILSLGDQGHAPSYTQTPSAFNNTLSCFGNYAGSSAVSGGNGNSSTFGTSNATFIGNIEIGLHFDFNVVTTSGVWYTVPGGFDYNIYGDVHTDSGGTAINWAMNALTTSTLSPVGTVGTWQYDLTNSCGGCSPLGTGSPWPGTQGDDLHSQVATNAVINLSGSGIPGAGSPALASIHGSINLTAFCASLGLPAVAAAACTQDIAGNQRSATLAWDAGAYCVTNCGSVVITNDGITVNGVTLKGITVNPLP